MQNSSGEYFEMNEVVWAKVLGYPWWPAQIASFPGELDNVVTNYRVNFIADRSHAILRKDKLKKWDYIPQQPMSKKLKEAIIEAEQIRNGQEVQSVQALDQLKDHVLKKFVIQLNQCLQMEKGHETVQHYLNSIDDVNLLQLVKLNFGSQLFSIHQTIKKGPASEVMMQTQEFIDNLVAIIGFQEQPNIKKNKAKKATPSSEETLEEITKCVIIQKENDIKKKKSENNNDQRSPTNQQ